MTNVDSVRDRADGVPDRDPPRGLRGRSLVGVALLGVAALALIAWLRPTEEVGDVGITLDDEVACAEQIFTGRVVEVDDGPADVDDGVVAVTFAVEEWLEPTTGDDVVVVDVATDPGATTRLSPGDELRLVLVPGSDDVPFSARAQGAAANAEEARRLLAAPERPTCTFDAG